LHQRDQAWYRTVLCDLEIVGDVYQGLLDLHGPATSEADIKAIRSLAERGYLPNRKDKAGLTPLLQAIAKGKYTFAEHLLSVSNKDAKYASGESLLHYTVRQSRSDARDTFIVNLMEIGFNETLVNHKGQTAEAILEAKEPNHYRVLQRRLVDQLRSRVHSLQAHVESLEASVAKLSARNAPS